MTTGRINQVSHSLTGPGPFSRPPTRRALQRDRPATVQPRLLLPPSLRPAPSSAMSRVARPSKACHSGHPAHRPPARLATRQSSRSTHAQHTTHTQLPDHQPSAGWFTPQPQPPDQPRQSQSTSLLQPGGLSQVHGLVACATPSRTDSTPLRHRSRVTSSRELPALHPVLWSCLRNRQPPP